MEDDPNDFVHYLMLAYHVYCTTPRDASLVLKLFHHRLTCDLKGVYTVISSGSPDLSGEDNKPMTPRSPMGIDSACAQGSGDNSRRSLALYASCASYPHTDVSENEQYAFIIIRSLYKQLARRTHPDRCTVGEENGAIFAVASEFHRRRELAGMIYCALSTGIDVSIDFDLVYDQLHRELRRLVHHVEKGTGPFCCY
tara:strand:+ start:2758 stop:3348 length:591 start_codon:yes stop_codon:yes gene_type:complete